LPCYFINEKFWQKQLFLVLRLVWVAGWLWAFHKQLWQESAFFTVLMQMHPVAIPEPLPPKCSYLF
jgi:hypothetical protein